MRNHALLFASFGALATAQPANAQAGETPSLEAPAQGIRLTAPQMFALADDAVGRGDIATAETVYRALARDPNQQIRSEARFRLARMLVQLRRLTDAALLFRQILDDEPGAQRVRLELARVLELMGDEAGARRTLREAQAGGLPPDVARIVDRYSNALRARKKLGASLEIAIAPNSNINRATRSSTLGTVVGNFTLDRDARQRSGVGLALRGQTYARAGLGTSIALLGRISAAADLYRHSRFNDLALAVSAGPELSLGADRLTAEIGLVRRWYGSRHYSDGTTASLNYLHPLDRQSQLWITGTVGRIDNKLNPLQDGHVFAGSVMYERALSSRTGIAATLAFDRQDLRDPGYSMTGGQLSLVGYHDMGRMTLIGTLGVGHSKADERQFLYPDRHKDTLYKASLAATFRQLTLWYFAPLIRVTAERNRSTVEIFDYRRLRADIGITRAF